MHPKMARYQTENEKHGQGRQLRTTACKPLLGNGGSQLLAIAPQPCSAQQDGHACQDTVGTCEADTLQSTTQSDLPSTAYHTVENPSSRCPSGRNPCWYKIGTIPLKSMSISGLSAYLGCADVVSLLSLSIPSIPRLQSSLHTGQTRTRWVSKACWQNSRK